MVSIAALMIWGKLPAILLLRTNLKFADSTIGLGLHVWEVEVDNYVKIAKVNKTQLSKSRSQAHEKSDLSHHETLLRPCPSPSQSLHSPLLPSVFSRQMASNCNLDFDHHNVHARLRIFLCHSVSMHSNRVTLECS